MTPSNSSPPASGDSRAAALITALLVLLTLAIYWPATRHGFVNYDDPDYVTANPRVQAGLTAESVRWAFTSYYSSNWHPLTWLAHMLDSQLFGAKPAGHHFTSVLIHALNAGLVFLVLRFLTGALWPSTMVAALFAWHPLHVESVAWVSERKDVLCAFFGLLSIWAYGGYARAREKKAELRLPAVMNYALSLLFLALGLLAKPMLVTLPFVLLLIDLWPLQRFHLGKSYPRLARRLSELVLEKAPFFLLIAASSIVTFRVQGASGAVVALEHVPMAYRLANAVNAYGVYLAKTFVPTHLAAFYPAFPLSWTSPQVLGALLVLVLVSLITIRLIRKGPWALAGWFWFLGMLVPVIGIVQVGKQAFADRYTYLPHVGLFVFMVWAARAVAGSNRGKVLAVGGAAVLAACAGLTCRQIPHWHDTKSLFSYAASVTRSNYVAYTVLASTLLDEKKFDEAAEYCRQALDISPRYSEAHNVLGNVRFLQRRFEAATESFQAAIDCDRTFAAPYHGLGSASLQLGRPAEAEKLCREALRLDPLQPGPRYCLAEALHQQNRLDEAIVAYRELLEQDPSHFAARRSLANALVAKGKTAEAAEELDKALRLKPGEVETRTALAVLRMDLGNLDAAARLFSEVVLAQSTNAIAHYNLALISQGKGDRAAAINHLRQTVAVQPNWPEALNNLAWLLAASPRPEHRNGLEAVGFARRACELTANQQAVFLGTLGAALATAGKYQDAIASAEQAVSVAKAAGQEEVARRNHELIELYKAGKAFYEPE